jgi:hypothetical protein
MQVEGQIHILCKEYFRKIETRYEYRLRLSNFPATLSSLNVMHVTESSYHNMEVRCGVYLLFQCIAIPRKKYVKENDFISKYKFF